MRRVQPVVAAPPCARRFFLLFSLRHLALSAACLAVSPSPSRAQENPPAQNAPAPLPDIPASPEAAPASAENAPLPIAPEETPLDAPQIVGPSGKSGDATAPATPLSRLFAPDVSYSGGVIIAQGTTEKPVRFETTAGVISALRVELDTQNQRVQATGEVQLERQIETSRRSLLPRRVRARPEIVTATETLSGQNLSFDFKTRAGTLDNAQIQLAALFVSAGSLQINGRRYSARDVLVRPGGLSPAETKIYGTPPLSIRAKSLEATLGEPGTPNASRPAVVARGGGLFFRNTRILPLPTYVFRAGIGGSGGNQSAFQLTPGISFNSADRVLLTTRLSYPLSKTPGQLSTFADIGLSQRIGIRGGVGLESQSKLGSLTLRARRADVVQTQLTNRIELDRKPEILYESPAFFAFPLPGQRRAGFTFNSSYGSYGERRIGDDSATIDATRFTTRLLFSTRLDATDGAFLRLFALTSRYGGNGSRYENRGFEVGYVGQFVPRVRGQITLRSTSLSGQTPFRFDRIEIARELRSTFDIELTPRYLLPIDLRYDLNRRALRDASFGVLRSYKVFAYGLVYQRARQDLRLEVRQGF